MTADPAGTAAFAARAATEWERSAEVLWRRTAVGVVVLPVDGSAAVSLEGFHAALWEAMLRPMTVEALTDQLAAFLPDDAAAADRATAEAVRSLVAAGAVRECLPT